MKSRSSWAMAYCGMAAALSVALMLLGAVVPVLMFIAPAAASLLIATVCIECGMKMALTAYGAVSLLSLLFVPDKEVALVFVFLLGYYPLVKPKFERIRRSCCGACASCCSAMGHWRRCMGWCCCSFRRAASRRSCAPQRGSSR